MFRLEPLDEEEYGDHKKEYSLVLKSKKTGVVYRTYHLKLFEECHKDHLANYGLPLQSAEQLRRDLAFHPGFGTPLHDAELIVVERSERAKRKRWKFTSL